MSRNNPRPLQRDTPDPRDWLKPAAGWTTRKCAAGFHSRCQQHPSAPTQCTCSCHAQPAGTP